MKPDTYFCFGLNIMKIIPVFLLTVALAGCAGSAPKVDLSGLETLRRGEANANEVYKQFGRPNFLSRNMDGTQTAVYLRDIAGGTETFTLSFDQKGVLNELKATRPGAAKAAAEPAPAAARTSNTAKDTQAVEKAASPASTTQTTQSAPAPAAKSEITPWSLLNLENLVPSEKKDPRNPK